MNTITQKSIKAFERQLRENERAEATVQKYVATILKLKRWLGARELTKDQLMEWKRHMLESHAPQSVNGAICAVNTYLTMLGLTEYKLKMLKVQRRIFRNAERELTKEEYDRLVATAREHKKERLALCIEAIGGTGIRVSELKYITVEAAQTGRAEISLKGKIRTIFISGKLSRKLLRYARKQKIVSGEIFLTRNGTSLSRKQIWTEMKALCAQAGVEQSKVFPHNLRHLFARRFYQSTRDVVTLADMLGHSSVETTRIYLMSTGVEHARVLERLGLVS